MIYEGNRRVSIVIVGGLFLIFGVVIGFFLGRINADNAISFSPKLTPTATVSPEQTYAKEMVPALEKLAFFINGPITDWNNILNSKSSRDVTYSDYLVFYPVTYQYTKPSDLRSSEEYEVLIQALDNVINAGFDLTSELGAHTPPQSIKVAHDEVFACVQYEIDRMDGIRNLLETGVYNEIPSKCRAFSSALDKILLFIVENGLEAPNIENPDLLSSQ